MSNNNVYQVTFDESDEIVVEGCRKKIQIICRLITDNLITRLLIIILILIDMTLIIYIAVKNDGHNSLLDIMSLTISCIFVVEVIMRVYGLGPSTFFRNWINVVDFIVVFATFIWSIISCVAIIFTPTNALPFVRIITRLPRICNVVRIASNKHNFLNSSRYVTSENKRRYRLDGFDLDLCYITNRVIAMSFPSSGLAALYRNPITDVAKFLNERHGKRYKVYNLCEERGYNTELFNNQVERYLIADHNVPKLEEMIQFARSSRHWLSLNDKNVIAVHCRGGKGRTGTMICVHLIDFEIFTSAQLSLEYFGQRRTDLAKGRKFQGVETPSQSRYVAYFEEVKKTWNFDIPAPIILTIERIVIHGIKGIGNGDGSDLRCTIHGPSSAGKLDKLVDVFLKEDKTCKCSSISGSSLDITILQCPPLQNDIKIKFYSLSRNVPKSYDDCAFFFWFHTLFIKDNRLYLSREELDNPHKKSTWKVFGADFGVEVFFKIV